LTSMSLAQFKTFASWEKTRKVGGFLLTRAISSNLKNVEKNYQKIILLIRI